MDPKLQTSFIPKRPIVPTTTIIRQSSIDLVSLVIGVIFFAVAAVAVGVFIFERTLIKGNEGRKQLLQKEIEAFEPELTKELTILKARLDSASEILKNHVALTAFFDLFETLTVKNIQFKEFDFNVLPGERATVAMSGISPNYSSVIYQSDVFTKNENIKDPVFSGFDLDAKGSVTFKINVTLDPKIIAYKQLIIATPSPAIPANVNINSGAGATSTATSTATATTTPQ